MLTRRSSLDVIISFLFHYLELKEDASLGHVFALFCCMESTLTILSASHNQSFVQESEKNDL